MIRKLIFGLLCVLPYVALSEPTPTVTRLMNEPASIFDLGLLRMRQANSENWVPTLQEKMVGSALAYKNDGVVYDWDKNEISIYATFTFNGAPTEQECERVLRLYRDAVSPLRKSPSGDEFAIGRLAFYFDHVNYSAGRVSKDNQREIVGLMEFTIGIEGPAKPVDPAASAVMKAFSKDNGPKIYCSLTFFDDVPSYTKFNFD